MRVLQVGADRSKRGVLFPGTDARARQAAYAAEFGDLDIIAFSLAQDDAEPSVEGALRIYPTSSPSRFGYIPDAWQIFRHLPRPEVISAQDPFETGVAAYFLARIARVPLHIQIHTDFLSAAYRRHSIPNRIRALVARFILSRASRVRVVSERLKRSLVERGIKAESDVTVLPIFVDTGRFKEVAPDERLAARLSRYTKKLLVVSRLEPEKNVALALHAFASFAQGGECLIIVGDGSKRRELEETAKNIGLFDRVFFEGERDPAPYYALADLVLVTSKYEGYGAVIIEALAAGKPVLSTDVGIAKEAGALVATEEAYGRTLAEWLKSGARSGTLAAYPYTDFAQYVNAYCADIMSSIKK